MGYQEVAQKEASDEPTHAHLRDDVCAELAGILANGVETHRCLAAQAIGRIRHHDSIGALVEALLDEDEDVRTDAAAALARMADQRAAEALMESLVGDPCPEVKQAAIDALIRLGHPEIGSLLRRLVKGRDAAIVLDDGDFYDSGWDDWLDLQVKAIEGLGTLGDTAAAPLIAEAIDDEFGQDVSEPGFAALAKLGDAGAAVLTRYLRRNDVRLRRRAAAALAGMPGGSARAGIKKALVDPAAEVRLALVEALIEAPGEAELAKLIADPAPQLRARALQRWGATHREIAFDHLDDPAPEVQVAALQAIGDASKPLSSAEMARLQGLLEARPTVAAAAAEALAKGAGDEMFDVLAAMARNREQPLEARLGALKAAASIGGDKATAMIAESTVDPDRSVRLEALSALLSLARRVDSWPNAAGMHLLAVLESVGPNAETIMPAPDPIEAPPDSEVQGDAKESSPSTEDERAAGRPYASSTLGAILAAGEITTAAADPAIEDVELNSDDLDYLALAKATPKKRRAALVPDISPDADARRYAARLLGDLAVPEVAMALARQLDSADDDLRLAAADSLASLAKRLPVLPQDVGVQLRTCLDDRNRGLRLAATRALGSIGGDGSADALTVLLGDEDSFVRIEAIRALCALGRRGTEIAALLNDPEPGVRSAAAKAVAGSGDGSAVDRLVEFAFQEEGFHCREAGRHLRFINASAAARRFLEVLRDRDRMRGWPVAISALEELYAADAGSGEAQFVKRDQEEGSRNT